MKRASLRTRLTLWYTAALGVTLIAFALVVAELQFRAMGQEFDERLQSAAGVVDFAVRDMRSDVGTQATAQRLLRELRFVEVDVAIAVGDSGPRSAFTASDSLLSTVLPGGPCHERGIAQVTIGALPYRRLMHCVPQDEANPPLTVVVGASEDELVGNRGRLELALGLALLVGIGLTAVGGHWLSGKALAPIRRMGEEVRYIGSENLDGRVRVDPSEGEIAELSRLVNDLFDRLAGTLARERQFLANAAHALRTPVAVLQGEVTELAAKGALGGQAPASLADIMVLTKHLARTIEYLLALARRDAGHDTITTQHVYLDDIVSGTVARLTRVADAGNARLAWGRLEETPIRADPHLVDQIAQILVENALQYGGPGATVTISVAPDADAGELTVEDTGPGLERADIESLFTPFVRGSAARLTKAPGSGLGLAVARWMVQACGGQIGAENAAPRGARFRVRFPLGR